MDDDNLKPQEGSVVLLDERWLISMMIFAFVAVARSVRLAEYYSLICCERKTLLNDWLIWLISSWNGALESTYISWWSEDLRWRPPHLMLNLLSPILLRCCPIPCDKDDKNGKIFLSELPKSLTGIWFQEHVWTTARGIAPRHLSTWATRMPREAPLD
jgi:hypothetical protein